MVQKVPAKTIILSYLALLIANLIWAAAGPIIKLTLQYIPPFTFLFYRFLLVCLLILPFLFIEIRKVKVYVTDYWKIFLLGLFSQSGLIFIFWGLKYTTATDAAIIGTIGVLMSMAAGHYFFYEKMNRGVLIGFLLALLGSMVVILEPFFTGQGIEQGFDANARVFGNFLVFLNHITFLLYIVWSKISFGEHTKIIKKTLHFVHIKPMKGKYSASLLTGTSFFVGLVTMLPFALFENLGLFGNIDYDLTQLPPDAFLGLAFMVIFSSIVAYFMFEWALKYISVGETSILGYVSAIFGVPFAFWILGELPTKFGLVGAAIIAFGVLISEISAHFVRKKQQHKSWFHK